MALRYSKERYRRITENMSDMVSDVDAEGFFQYVSPSHQRILGYRPEDLLGTAAFDKFHPDDKDRVSSVYMEGVITKTDSEAEYRYRHADGHYVWLRSSGHIILNGAGEYVGSIINSSDITERKRAEEQLWATKERLRLALQVSKQGYYEWDIQNDHLYYSDQYLEILEFGRDELEPRIRSWKKLIHPQDKTAVFHALKNHIDGRTSSYDATYRLKVKSGAWRWFRDHAEVVSRDTKGSHLCMMGTITDVTPYKEFEQELEKKVEERTAELVEVNSALKILLKQREQDKTDTEETMVANLKFMVFPYLHKLKRSALNVQQKEWVSLVDENLNKVSAPFIKKLSSKYSSLTPKEIQVAECIRSGKTSKEIAEMMNISARTVDVLRYSVRKKLGLNNKKANLQSLLSSL